MIHILTEDSGNGFEFCKLIKSLYFDTESINLEMETLKQRCTRGYKRYKETSGLIEWKECQIFHSIFT